MEHNYICTVCGNAQGNREFVFHDLETFINHVLEQGPKFQKVVALAHNGARFDTLLVARSLIENQNLSPGIIAQGQKIILLTVNNIIFRDMYLFMGGKLADLPRETSRFFLTPLKTKIMMNHGQILTILILTPNQKTNGKKLLCMARGMFFSRTGFQFPT